MYSTRLIVLKLAIMVTHKCFELLNCEVLKDSCCIPCITDDLCCLQGTAPKKHSTVVVSETVRETGTTNGLTG